MKIKFTLFLLFFVTVLFFSFTPALAQTKPSKQISFKGISISPAIQNIDLQEGQPSSVFKVRIDNNLNTPVDINVTSLDFKSLNESGGLAFIGNQTSQLNKYGLADYISINPSSFQLKGNEGRFVEITIENRSDLSPGGHYASILFNNSGDNAGKNNRVDINQVVATLVFVKKLGGEIYVIELQKPNIGTSYVSLPKTFNLFFKNTGNVQTPPRGVVNIYGPRGDLIKSGIINKDSSLVLPESTRLLRTELFDVKKAWLPGYYKAVINYYPEGQLVGTTSEYKFLYFNAFFLLGLVVLVIIAGAFGWRNYRSWK